jgi:hypothetical protein
MGQGRSPQLGVYAFMWLHVYATNQFNVHKARRIPSNRIGSWRSREEPNILNLNSCDVTLRDLPV